MAPVYTLMFEKRNHLLNTAKVRSNQSAHNRDTSRLSFNPKMKGYTFPVYLCTSCCKDLLWCLTFPSLTWLVLKSLVFNNSCGSLQSLKLHRCVKLLSLCIVGCCNNGLNFSYIRQKEWTEAKGMNRGNHQSECNHPSGEWIHCCMNGWLYMYIRVIMAWHVMKNWGVIERNIRIHHHANCWSTC